MHFKTVIQPINDNSLRISKDIITAGGLVAFPTETVYGLGANAYSDSAVENIYKVKGRPQDNPLIVHIHKDFDLESLVYDDKSYVKKLRDAFLPGALTLVYKSKNTVSKRVSPNIDTLAVRVPSHEGAQKFLKFVNLPIAAPSANISKHISPVTANHVLNDLDGKIMFILDGGKSNSGIESTVLDVTGDVPTILRFGSITQSMIKNVCGDCKVGVNLSEKIKSPGIKYKHYMPSVETMFFSATEIDDAVKVYEICAANNQSVCIVCDYKFVERFKDKEVYNLGASASEVSKNLYSVLRDAEKKYSLIIGIEISGDENYDGVKDRYYKAFSVLK